MLKSEWIEVVTWIEVRWPQVAMEDQTVDAYFVDLVHLSAAEVQAAVEAYYRTGRDWPPNSGHILATVDVLRAEAPCPSIDVDAFRDGQQLAEATWSRASAAIAASVPETTFRLWIEPLVAVGGDGETILLVAPTGKRAWVERRYMGLIGEAVRAETNFGGVAIVDAALVETPARASQPLATVSQIGSREAIAA